MELFMNLRRYACTSRVGAKPAVHRFQIRLTEEEYLFIKREAENKGWSMSKFIIEQVFSNPNILPTDKVTRADVLKLGLELRQLCTQLNAVARNINHIAYIANLEHRYLDVAQLKKYSATLDELVNVIKPMVKLYSANTSVAGEEKSVKEA